MIQLLRVDYRLIHGQITTAWISHLGADCILIANDSVPGDSLRKNALKLAKPAGLKLVMKSMDDSIAALQSGVTDSYKLFILVENVNDAKRLIRECPQIKRLNLGNIRMSAGASQLGTTVFASEQDLKDLKEIQEMGVAIDVQSVPRDKMHPVRL